MEKMVNKQHLQSRYKGKKVFITGHTGFKGSWLSLWLQLLGATIKGYALTPEKPECIFNLTHPYSGSESIIADIRDRKRLVQELVSFEPDFVFHLAAQPLVRRSYEIPAETFDVNVSGTANVLEAIRQVEKKCTVIIITTDKVYENKEQDILYNETDVLGGFDPYSASKACAELVVNSFRNSFFHISEFRKHQKSISSVRAGNVIGGGDYSDDRIIPDIVKALNKKDNIIIRNPHSVRPWQHVLEPLGGYLLLAEKMNADVQYSGAYNFGPNPGDHLEVKDLAELAIKVWGSGNWKDGSDKNQPHEAGLLKLDITKSQEMLGWRPKLDARQAIEMTIDWYRNAPASPLEYTLAQIKQYMTL